MCIILHFLFHPESKGFADKFSALSAKTLLPAVNRGFFLTYQQFCLLFSFIFAYGCSFIPLGSANLVKYLFSASMYSGILVKWLLFIRMSRGILAKWLLFVRMSRGILVKICHSVRMFRGILAKCFLFGAPDGC